MKYIKRKFYSTVVDTSFVAIDADFINAINKEFQESTRNEYPDVIITEEEIVSVANGRPADLTEYTFYYMDGYSYLASLEHFIYLYCEEALDLQDSETEYVDTYDSERFTIELP